MVNLNKSTYLTKLAAAESDIDTALASLQDVVDDADAIIFDAQETQANRQKARRAKTRATHMLAMVGKGKTKINKHKGVDDDFKDA